ncbi:MAG: LemA family protein [Limnochordia bacterium]|nr:LemA family protein [Limnochordia bacterium]
MNWFLVILGVVVIYLIFLYNGLVTLRERVKNAWAQVDVQLKRRYDLIPNLVNTVKGYAAHEKGTLEEVTKARTQAMSAGGPAEAGQAESALSSTLRTLFAVAENYPELKADANFRELQKELSDTESKIAYSRQFYNDTVQKYNIRVQRFPAVLVAGLFGFQNESFFTLDEAATERQPINVDFS